MKCRHCGKKVLNIHGTWFHTIGDRWYFGNEDVYCRRGFMQTAEPMTKDDYIKKFKQLYEM